jgi:hypothetical protein
LQNTKVSKFLRLLPEQIKVKRNGHLSTAVIAKAALFINGLVLKFKLIRIIFGVVIKGEILILHVVIVSGGIGRLVECGENFLNNEVDNMCEATDLGVLLNKVDIKLLTEDA